MSAADRARARYSWEQIAVDTDRVYRSLLPEPTSTDTADVSGDDQLDRV